MKSPATKTGRVWQFVHAPEELRELTRERLTEWVAVVPPDIAEMSPPWVANLGQHWLDFVRVGADGSTEIKGRETGHWRKYTAASAKLTRYSGLVVVIAGRA